MKRLWHYKITVLGYHGTKIASYVFKTKKEAISYLKHKELFIKKIGETLPKT